MRPPQASAGVVLRVDDRWMSLAAARELLARDARPDVEDDEQPAALLRRLCRAAVRALPADGAAVSVLADGGGLALAATSGRSAAALADLEFTLGEGPCADAVAASRPVLVPDVAALPAGRWPAFTPSALALGIGALFAFPLRVGAAHLGALALHRRTPGLLDRRATGLALAFADIAVETLLDGQARRTDDPGTGDPGTDAPAADGAVPDDLLGVQYVVFQAQGMTMVDLGVPIADALARLRARAFAEGRPLHEVAQDVVDGTLRLEPDGP